MVPLPVKSEAWVGIMDFVIEHEQEIRTEVDGFGDLKPIWDFMNRNC